MNERKTGKLHGRKKQVSRLLAIPLAVKSSVVTTKMIRTAGKGGVCRNFLA